MRDYLRQYKRCKNKEAVLRERIARIKEYKKDPLKSSELTGMPRGGGISPGAASLTLEIDSLMERVEEQVAASVAVLENVMDVLDFALLKEKVKNARVFKIEENAVPAGKDM